MRHSRFDRGFTLIELLIVMVIVATVLSIAMLSFGLLGNDRDLQTEGRRFTSLMEVVQDEASMQGREFGIELMTSGYRFVEYDALTGQWADVPGDDTLRLRALPEDVEFELFLEDKRILLENDPAPFDEPDDPDKPSLRSASDVYNPHLLVYSSGDATPFELHLWRRFDDSRVVLRGNALGVVESINPDEE
jgi:general secretion pathway protein H